MVEHLWIRLAELREEAAEEEWQRRHPRLTRWRSRCNRLRVRLLLLRKGLAEIERVRHWLELLQSGRSRMDRASVSLYLLVTRMLGYAPARDFVGPRLSTRELIEELVSRNMDHAECVEREDLLDMLCGPKPMRAEASSDRSIGEYEVEHIDKMV
jgi:hypothetical protein